MSIDMYVSSSQEQATSVNTMCQKQIQGYQQLQQAINQFVMSSAELQGKTYDSAKQYFSAVLLPLAKGGMLLSEATAKSCQKFPDDYQSQVDSEDLKSSELEEQIKQYQQGIDTANAILQSLSTDPALGPLMNAVRKGVNNVKEGQEKAKKKLEEKLEKLKAFDASSPSIFSEIATLESAVNAGAKQAGTCWNSSTGMFNVPKDMPWIREINSYEERKEIEQLAKQYGLSDELAKDLQTFHKRMDDYAKKNGLTPEEKQHLYAMLIGSLSDAYTNKIWQIAGGTVSNSEAVKKLKEMGYSDEEIKRFKYNLTQNHNGKDNVDENDFVHTMGSLAVMMYPNTFADVMMKYGTSSQATAAIRQSLSGDPVYIFRGFIDSMFRGEMNKNAAATFRGDIASASLGIQDVRADIDALNIYYRLKSQPNLSMTQVVNQYAKDLQNGGNRAEEIAKHLGNGDAEKGKEIFYKEVHKPITDPGNLFLQVKDKNDIEAVRKAAKEFWKLYERELKGK